MINSFETCEIWTLGNLWINILRVISSLIYLFITNFSYEVGWPVGELGILNEFRIIPSG